MKTINTNHKPQIMIANESIIDISLIESTLSSYGMTNVISTSDSKKVSEMMNTYNPEVLVLDLDMPKVDGIGILEEVKMHAKSDEEPVIIACVKKNSLTAEMAKELGVYKVIEKPIKSTEVMNAIWNYLLKRIGTKAS